MLTMKIENILLNLDLNPLIPTTLVADVGADSPVVAAVSSELS